MGMIQLIIFAHSVIVFIVTAFILLTFAITKQRSFNATPLCYLLQTLNQQHNHLIKTHWD